jgi:hypothetical protein
MLVKALTASGDVPVDIVIWENVMVPLIYGGKITVEEAGEVEESLVFNINDEEITVAVLDTDTAAEIAGKIAAAINGQSILFTATQGIEEADTEVTIEWTEGSKYRPLYVFQSSTSETVLDIYHGGADDDVVPNAISYVSHYRPAPLSYRPVSFFGADTVISEDCLTTDSILLNPLISAESPLALSPYKDYMIQIVNTGEAQGVVTPSMMFVADPPRS